MLKINEHVSNLNSFYLFVASHIPLCLRQFMPYFPCNSLQVLLLPLHLFFMTWSSHHLHQSFLNPIVTKIFTLALFSYSSYI